MKFIAARKSRTQQREKSAKALYGERVEETLSGLPAIVFQHEFDHLNGVMHVDREMTTFVRRPEDQVRAAAHAWYVKQSLLHYGEC